MGGFMDVFLSVTKLWKRDDVDKCFYHIYFVLATFTAFFGAFPNKYQQSIEKENLIIEQFFTIQIFCFKE